ncbi:HEAT repeat domain-containing protein [Streptomyces diastatochromogenes]|nr:HEAT repeat domain-containing protein [Streptomyces diastatochromogenes]
MGTGRCSNSAALHGRWRVSGTRGLPGAADRPRGRHGPDGGAHGRRGRARRPTANGGRRAPAALAEDEEQPSTVRARAVRALGLIGAPDTLPVVLACARSPHEAVRAQAVPAWAGFPWRRRRRHWEFVTHSTEPHGTEPDVARAAVHALGRIGARPCPSSSRSPTAWTT